MRLIPIEFLERANDQLFLYPFQADSLRRKVEMQRIDGGALAGKSGRSLMVISSPRLERARSRLETDREDVMGMMFHSVFTANS